MSPLGLEPRTQRLKVFCSTDWATGSNIYRSVAWPKSGFILILTNKFNTRMLLILGWGLIAISDLRILNFRVPYLRNLLVHAPLQISKMWVSNRYLSLPFVRFQKFPRFLQEGRIDNTDWNFYWRQFNQLPRYFWKSQWNQESCSENSDISN